MIDEGFKKTVINSVNFFGQVNAISKSVRDSSVIAGKASNKIVNAISLLIIKQPSTEMKSIAIEKESIYGFKKQDTSLKINKKTLVALIIGLIPFLINDEVKKYLSSFVEELIGTNAVEKLKQFNITVTGIIDKTVSLSKITVGTFVAVKLFSTVANTIELIRQLAILTGLLSVLNDDEHTDIDNQKRRVEKERERNRRQQERILRERQRLERSRINIRRQALNLRAQQLAMDRRLATERGRIEADRRAMQAQVERERLRQAQALESADIARQRE